MLARFDQRFETVRPNHLRRPISRTITGQVFVTTRGFVTQPPFRLLVETFGVDRIMLPADDPFTRMARTIKLLKALAIADSGRAKIVHGNADRVLKLKS